MTTELNAEEKALLKEIMNDKFAAGPFCGMVFNAVIHSETTSVEHAIHVALQVRLVAKALSQ